MPFWFSPVLIWDIWVLAMNNTFLLQFRWHETG